LTTEVRIRDHYSLAVISSDLPQPLDEPLDLQAADGYPFSFIGKPNAVKARTSVRPRDDQQSGAPDMPKGPLATLG
jgi:hypothetical protein